MSARRLVPALASVLLLGAAACSADDSSNGSGDSDSDSPTNGDAALRVVTTVAPVTDIVQTVAGPDAEVEGIVPPGADSHTFEPDPSVARTLADARLFIANGLFLEEPSIQLAEANLPEDGEIVTLADQVVDEDEWVYDFSFPEEGGHPNPHLWTSPPMAAEYAALVADELSRVDPDHAGEYQQRYEAFAGRVDTLDEAIATVAETIPEEHRKLVTYHDSFPYFAPRYGFEIIGAVQPADFSEPSPREVSALIDQLRAEGVPAVFGSEAFPSDTLAQIADEADAEYVENLRDDVLPGEPGDPEHSYVGMMVANVETLADALGGDPAALDEVPLGEL